MKTAHRIQRILAHLIQRILTHLIQRILAQGTRKPARSQAALRRGDMAAGVKSAETRSILSER